MRSAAIALLALLAGCNLYNPSGKGDPDTDREWIEQGNAELRDLDFEAAKRSFGHVLSKDSGSVDAWTGYAKAVAGQSLDIGRLLKEGLDAQAEQRKPLWDMPCYSKDSVYTGLLPLWGVFQTWHRLDSTGRAWMPDDQKREHSLLSLAHSMLSLWDYNGDLRIDSAHGDAMSWTLFRNLGSDGGFKPSLDLISFGDSSGGKPDTSGKVNPTKIAEFNNLLDRSGSDFASIANLAKGDTAIQAIFSSIEGQSPDAITMFKVSDSIDNDWDGCVDEEVLDSLDNDGDGMVDEDARAGYHPADASSSRGAKSGALALRFLPDRIRNDRLADSTGRGHKGASPFDTTWYYGDAEGHLRVFQALWNGSYAWKTSCSFDSCQGSLSDVKNRLIVNDRIRKAKPGQERARLGCSLLGGCWCKQIDLFYTKKSTGGK